MTRRLLIAALVVSVLFNVGFMIGRAQSRQAVDAGAAYADSVDLVAEQLDLSPEQRTQFAALRQDFAGEWEALQAQQALLRQELAEQFASDTPDMDRVEELMQQGMELHRELRQAGAERFREFAGKLNPQQRERLGRMMRRHRPPPFNGHDPWRKLKAFDRNDDGVIDEQEKQAAWQRLKERRRDWPEREHRPGGRFERGGVDRPGPGGEGDPRLELGPARDVLLREGLRRRFDVNDDGAIDEMELRALLDWLNAAPPPPAEGFGEG
jgi:uncharacterized membrane protein